jgi:RIO-like serine/threonine protein kinase
MTTFRKNCWYLLKFKISMLRVVNLKKRVVISSIGAITPIGIGKDSYF